MDIKIYGLNYNSVDKCCIESDIVVPVNDFRTDNNITENQYIRFVYMIPKGKEINKNYSSAIKKGASNLQEWYKKQLNGKTFKIYDPIDVYPTEHDERWYNTIKEGMANDQYILHHNAIKDVMTLTKATYYDPTYKWVFFIDVIPDRANIERKIEEQNGAATSANIVIIAGDNFADLTSTENNKVNRAIGVIGHELGHTFGLPDAPNNPDYVAHSMMYRGWDNPGFPNTYFLPENIQHLEQNNFIN